jgi:hypothetical protein
VVPSGDRVATNDIANLESDEITVQHRCGGRASQSEFGGVVHLCCAI